jgi:hypothetical protein
MLIPLTEDKNYDYKIIVRFTSIALTEHMPLFKPVIGLAHGHLKPPSMNLRHLYNTEDSAVRMVPACKFGHVHHG